VNLLGVVWALHLSPHVMLGQPPAAPAQTSVLLQNGGFEAVHETTPGPDGLVGNWRLGDPPQVPDHWNVNSAYPGRLDISQDKPHSGQRFIRILAPAKGTPHLYQMCAGLQAGKWYRVSAWARGGALAVSFYEYFQDGHIGGQGVAQLTAGSADWRQVSGFYCPLGPGYVQSALALSVNPGQTTEVDDVTLEPLDLPELPATAPDIIFENSALRLRLGANGTVKEFRAKPSGQDYAPGAPVPILSATRRNIETPLHSISATPSGASSLLQARFLDPDV